MISFRNFALRRGERLLLSQMDLTLQAGWRVGVVGRNGCGKSSLFAAFTREVEADTGDLDFSGKIRLASVAQETPSLPAIQENMPNSDNYARKLLLGVHERTSL